MRWGIWRHRWRKQLQLTELMGVLLWPSIIGLVGALITGGFRSAIHVVEYLLTGHTGGFVAVAESLAPLHRALVPALGGCLAGLILQYGMRLAHGRKTTDYMEAVALGDGFISIRASLVKSASSLMSIGYGGSIGREGAMVQLAAMFASLVGRLARFRSPSRRLLVACGAAAGLSSAYNAPLAATIFVAEIVLGSIELGAIGPVIVSAVVANATLHRLMGYAPVFSVADFRLVSAWEMPLYVMLGMIAGHLAPMFLWCLDRSRDLFGRLHMPITFKLTLGGLVVGVVSALVPEVWGNGYSLINSTLQHEWPWATLLVIFVAKIVATAANTGSGAVGGVFTPTLFCGAALGGLVGTAFHGAFPHVTGPAMSYAAVGMGAFLAGTTHAPLMSILMVFELTRQYQVVLPLMIAVIVAHYVAQVYRKGRSIYADALDVKKSTSPPDVAGFSLASLVKSGENTVPADATAESLTERFAHTSYNHMHVVDGEGRWVGVVGRWTRQQSGSRAADLVEASSRALTLEMPMEDVIRLATEIPSERLPVLDDLQSRHFLGTVSKTDLLAFIGLHMKVSPHV